MTKLLLTILLTLSFTLSASNNNGNFTLKKAEASKILVSQNFNSCEDECYLEFDYCIQGLPPQSIEVEYCEMDLSECLIWCN